MMIVAVAVVVAVASVLQKWLSGRLSVEGKIMTTSLRRKRKRE